MADSATLPPAVRELQLQALKVLEPPPVLRLSEWIESNLVLPASVSARAGEVELFPYQRGIADAISDPTVERITVVKAARLGYTTLLTATIASFVANDPCPLILLMPTEDDARGIVVDDLEPIFAATPAVRGRLAADLATGEDRNTLTSKKFPGGSLKVIASRSPRNLRRHNARVLLIDEADAMENSAEGSPIALAEKRTMSFDNRLIVMGSTPLNTDTSHVLKAYATSDQSRYEVPCPSCGTFGFIEWSHIEWPEGRPDQAFYRCPSCHEAIDEKHKPDMVRKGQWVAQRPEVMNHRGFLVNALVSPLKNAAWGRLAEEFLNVKDDPTTLQPFVNTVLAQGWNDSESDLDENKLAGRAEAFGLDRIPPEVLAIVGSVDVQDDRLELSVVGFSETEAFVMAHIIIWGSPDDDLTWAELDEALKTRWQHPFGGKIGIEATVVDSGDGDWTNKVYSFCGPRTNRGVMPIKGLSGRHPPIKHSEQKLANTGGARLWLVGVDGLKAAISTRLERGRSIRFSDSLTAEYYSQLTSERRVLRYFKGQPVRRYERVPGRRAEAWDCLVYALAARHRIQENWAFRAYRLKNPGPAPLPSRTPAQQPTNGGRRIIRSPYMS